VKVIVMDGAALAGGDSKVRTPAEHDNRENLVSVVDVEHIFRRGKSQGKAAVSNCSFRCQRSEFISIIGPSGCGKTTLLRIVGGLITPTRGQVLLAGEPASAHRLRLGMVFQRPVLLPWRTALGNIQVPGEIRGEGRIDRARAMELLDTVGLLDSADKLPHEMSGGMQQRVALCRALASDPELLLMDEPFGALDALTRSNLDYELLRIWETTKKTVLFVTHSVPEAIMLSDRVLVLSTGPGRIVEDIRIALPRPRSSDLRYSKEFLAMEAHLNGLLGAAISL
jgi:NitT/TauT family transport system ATP-binding protein